jgi:hypothetical protein
MYVCMYVFLSVYISILIYILIPAAGYSSFGLGASYNSLLSNGYASSAYSPYGSQAGYGCLNYANAFQTGDASGFGISSALAGAASGR